MSKETIKHAPIIINAIETVHNTPKNLPRRIDFLVTGLESKVKIMPFSTSFESVPAADKDARNRQHNVIDDIPISLIMRASSPKANMVNEKDKNIISNPPTTIK